MEASVLSMAASLSAGGLAFHAPGTGWPWRASGKSTRRSQYLGTAPGGGWRSSQIAFQGGRLVAGEDHPFDEGGDFGESMLGAVHGGGPSTVVLGVEARPAGRLLAGGAEASMRGARS